MVVRVVGRRGRARPARGRGAAGGRAGRWVRLAPTTTWTCRRRASASAARSYGFSNGRCRVEDEPDASGSSTSAAPPTWSRDGMREHEAAEPLARRGRELVGDPRLRRALVDEHRALGHLEEDRVALADVEEGDAQAGRRRGRRVAARRPPGDGEHRAPSRRRPAIASPRGARRRSRTTTSTAPRPTSADRERPRRRHLRVRAGRRPSRAHAARGRRPASRSAQASAGAASGGAGSSAVAASAKPRSGATTGAASAFASTE